MLSSSAGAAHSGHPPAQCPWRLHPCVSMAVFAATRVASSSRWTMATSGGSGARRISRRSWILPSSSRHARPAASSSTFSGWGRPSTLAARPALVFERRAGGTVAADLGEDASARHHPRSRSVIASCAASHGLGVPGLVRASKGCLRPSSGRRKWACRRNCLSQRCRQAHFLQPPLGRSATSLAHPDQP